MTLRSALWATALKLRWSNSEGLACVLKCPEVSPHRSLGIAVALTRDVLRYYGDGKGEERAVFTGSAALAFEHVNNQRLINACRECFGKIELSAVTEQRARAFHLEAGPPASTCSEHPRRSSTVVSSSGACSLRGLNAHSDHCDQSLRLGIQFRSATTEARWTDKLRSQLKTLISGAGHSETTVGQDAGRVDQKKEAAPQPSEETAVGATATAAAPVMKLEKTRRDTSAGAGFIHDISNNNKNNKKNSGGDSDRGSWAWSATGAPLALAGRGGVISTALLRYREVAALHAEAVVRRVWGPLALLMAAGSAMLLARAMHGTASLFFLSSSSSSETLAFWGFFSLASALVASGALFLRHLYLVDPDAVFRMAMRRLNSSAAALEVMGAPLGDARVRAFVVAGGGGLRFSRQLMMPTIAPHRCFMVFPLRGAERRGIVSAEVKKKRGKYYFKLLSIDVPTSSALDVTAEQRVFLVGDQAVYDSAGHLISDLRGPLVEVLSRRREFEIEDEKEDEEEARFLEEERRLKQEQLAAKERKKRAEEKAREKEKRQEERAYGL